MVIYRKLIVIGALLAVSAASYASFVGTWNGKTTLETTRSMQEANYDLSKAIVHGTTTIKVTDCKGDFCTGLLSFDNGDKKIAFNGRNYVKGEAPSPFLAVVNKNQVTLVDGDTVPGGYSTCTVSGDKMTCICSSASLVHSAVVKMVFTKAAASNSNGSA